MADFSASAVVAAMRERDNAASKIEIVVDFCAVGNATVSMRVVDWMLNGHAVCHGGFIFTLADTAFAYACNSANFNTVAAGCSIEFLAPAHFGDRLTATASERTQRGRHGIYDVDVVNQNKELIAVFRGKSARIAGNVIDERNNDHAGKSPIPERP